MPGIPKKEAEKLASVSGSNVYSLPEGILLKWCTLHHNKIFPTMQRRVQDFEIDLRDGLVISALLISHAPYINSGGRLWQSLCKDCRSKEDFMQNAAKVTGIMKDLNLHCPLTVDDLLRPVARDMMLQILYLYQTLPSYMPRTTIEFNGRLGEQIVKNIELTNPSKGTLTYQARMDGSPDFKLQQSSYAVESKQKVPVSIEFVGRFTREVEGVLFLTSAKDSSTFGNSLVFYLKSAIGDIRPAAHFHAKAKTYEPITVEVELENPFKGDCRFELSTRQERMQLGDVESKVSQMGGMDTERTRTSTGQSGSKDKAKGRSRAAQTTVYPADERITTFFHMKEKEITIKNGQKTTLNVTFVPFVPGVYQCNLYLCDEEHGEFMVQIHGVASKPTVTEVVKVSCETGNSESHTIQLPYQNAQRESALAMAEKEFGMAKPDGGGKTPRDKKDGKQEPPPLGMKVECTGIGAPVFLMHNQVVLTPQGAKLDDIKETVNAVELTFTPPDVLEYEAEICVYGPGDLRVFTIQGAGKSPGTEASLKFSAPARTPVKQMIPIVNQTDKPWAISAQFDCPDCPKNWVGPSSLNVAAYSTGEYPLEFVPPPFIPEEPVTCTGELLLRNTTIDDKYLYILNGSVEEPLAEDHIKVNCQVWERKAVVCKVPIIASDGEEVSIESDLLYISGPSVLVMEKANKSIDVELSVCPKQAGVYSGSLKFTAPSGEFAWFTVEVHAEPSAPVQELEINTALREAVGLDIAISNPLDTPVVFDVFIAGDGLLGESYVELGPNESAVYELIFSPLNYGVWDGSITFSNRDAGEFWYRLTLSADKPAPIVLDRMDCEIGKEMVTTITMENPLGELLELELDNSNDQNFEIIDEEPFILDSYGTLTLSLQYTPSTLKGSENAVLIFKNPKVADWEYHAEGCGVPPTTMAETLFYAPLGRSVTDSVNFRNPFPQTASLVVRLETWGSAKFDLMLKKPTLDVGAYSNLQIPVKFTAPSLDDAAGTVIVEAPTQGVVWSFPLKGNVFADTETASSYHYTCRARSRLEETLEIELSGLRDVDGEVPVTFEMKIPEAQERLFARALTVEPAGPLVASATAPLKFNLTFEPLRPLNATIQFMVKRQNGGVWKYALELEATEPEIDDTIVISSLLGQPSSVTFSLTNQFTVYTPFKAYFTPDSALEFSVEPKSGLLEPYGSAGTQFVVSYTSTAYGRMDTGRLVILTEEMQWTYEVRGTLPQYRPPEGEAKVVTELPGYVDQELHRIHHKPKKNYLRDQSRRG